MLKLNVGKLITHVHAVAEQSHRVVYEGCDRHGTGQIEKSSILKGTPTGPQRCPCLEALHPSETRGDFSLEEVV
jgi:hypothetical protein